MNNEATKNDIDNLEMSRRLLTRHRNTLMCGISMMGNVEQSITRTTDNYSLNYTDELAKRKDEFGKRQFRRQEARSRRTKIATLKNDLEDPKIKNLKPFSLIVAAAGAYTTYIGVTDIQKDAGFLPDLLGNVASYIGTSITLSAGRQLTGKRDRHTIRAVNELETLETVSNLDGRELIVAENEIYQGLGKKAKNWRRTKRVAALALTLGANFIPITEPDNQAHHSIAPATIVDYRDALQHDIATS